MGHQMRLAGLSPSPVIVREANELPKMEECAGPKDDAGVVSQREQNLRWNQDNFRGPKLTKLEVGGKKEISPAQNTQEYFLWYFKATTTLSLMLHPVCFYTNKLASLQKRLSHNRCKSKLQTNYVWVQWGTIKSQRYISKDSTSVRID